MYTKEQLLMLEVAKVIKTLNFMIYLPNHFSMLAPTCRNGEPMNLIGWVVAVHLHQVKGPIEISKEMDELFPDEYFPYREIGLIRLPENFEDAGYEKMRHLAKKLLGINGKNATLLFKPKLRNARYDAIKCERGYISPRRAAAVLRHLAYTGRVEWSRNDRIKDRFYMFIGRLEKWISEN